ncbi:MAG: sodium-dependent transporter [Verrucomicrobia bacterium]|nr:sodium-dependent transporter [Verrucomicrobiota bacterium]MCF7709006.1 sodium-dependent transporter [Verrucomicrobiota bacterium]
MRKTGSSEKWTSHVGVILAVAGSAVGLGNFLRFPGLAAQYGGGAFMIAYFISLLILGMPICWAEWTMGRYGGQNGFNSSPGIFQFITGRAGGRYLGVMSILIPVIIYMYYVYIEAWCLGYAVNFMIGDLDFPTKNVDAYSSFWAGFVGAGEDGSAVGFKYNQVGFYLIIVFILNFFIIYRGIARGIEFFCKYAMPALIVLGIIVLVRVLTLDSPIPDKPEQNIVNGLGYMWNPRDLSEQLLNPQLWLAASGQIFFSLSVGFGVIITYSSYLSNKDDIVLSSLSASSANEFCEVALGGMIIVPAAFMFLGQVGVKDQGTFDLGFKVLPLVFSKMPLGGLFGFIFFFLLFLAAMTSSLSMLQPGIAFFEEGLGLRRRQSVTLLGMITALGCMFIVYFSKDVKALDTVDFWIGTFMIFVLALIQTILFGWVLGVRKGWEEVHRGAAFRIPDFVKFVVKYISPLYLLGIFSLWVLFELFGWRPDTGEFIVTGYVADLLGSKDQAPNIVARMSVGMIVVVAVFLGMMISLAGKRWVNDGRNRRKEVSR